MCYPESCKSLITVLYQTAHLADAKEIQVVIIIFIWVLLRACGYIWAMHPSLFSLQRFYLLLKYVEIQFSDQFPAVFGR